MKRLDAVVAATILVEGAIALLPEILTHGGVWLWRGNL